MVVTCVTTSDPYRAGPEYASPEPLTVGREYDVLALESTRGGHWAGPWVFLFNDDDFWWPHAYPMDMFDVTDPTLPPDWICQSHPGTHAANVVISFPAWANDPHYYERLLDDDLSALDQLTQHVSSEQARRQREAREALRALLLDCGAPEEAAAQIVTLLECEEPELAREDVDALVESCQVRGRRLTSSESEVIETTFQLHAPGIAQP